MFALFIAASLLLSGVFWGWALQSGGAALDARTAARIFGWLCVAAIALGFSLSLRRRTAYDRPSPALAGALATTLLTGVGVLYLSYFAWDAPIRLAAAEQRPALSVAHEEIRKAAALAPPPAAPSPPAATRQAPKPKPHAVVAKATAPAPRAQATDACAGLKGVAEFQCHRCGQAGGLSGFLCAENARAEYCAGRDGTEPGCPWRQPTETGN